MYYNVAILESGDRFTLEGEYHSATGAQWAAERYIERAASMGEHTPVAVETHSDAGWRGTRVKPIAGADQHMGIGEVASEPYTIGRDGKQHVAVYWPAFGSEGVWPVRDLLVV